ncbi:MAG: leucine-rich repeat domain-containing protein [Prevotella sp.]
MKHSFTLRCLLSAFLAMMSMAVNAEVIEYEDDSFYYDLDTEAKTAEVWYKGSATEVSIPASVTYNGVAYTVTRLGDYCFYEYEGLTSVTIPSSVTSLGDYCFCCCYSLTSVTIPSSVTSLGEECFSGCGITSVTIPSSVTSLGKWCFSWCYDLASISVDVNNPVYDSRENCNAIIEKKTNTMVYGCKNTVFPSSVTSLGDYCFAGCGFTSFTIPSTIKSLGEWCLSGCSSLKTLTCEMPVAIEGTFFEPRYIEQTTLYVPESSVDSYQTTYQWNSFGTIKAIGGQYADYTDADGFAFCLNTRTKTAELTKYTGEATEVVIPTSVTYEGTEYRVTRVGTNSFNNCTSLTSITIPLSVTSLGGKCFYSCTSLTSVNIPSSIKALSAGCFRYCNSLKSIDIPTSVTSIGQECFHGCEALESIDIPSSVTSIGEDCFYFCTSLTSVNIPSSVTRLEDGCFYGCGSLKSVDIPSPVTSLGWECFRGCSSLTSITIPSSVTNMGWACFAYCPSLNTVTCETPVAIEGNFFGYTPIDKATLYVPKASLASYKATAPWSGFGTIEAIAGKVVDYTDNGFVFRLYCDDGVADLVQYTGSATEVTIPSSVRYEGTEYSVTTLGKECFYKNSTLQSVSIPSSVTSLGDNCFGSCTSLTSIVIPSSVTEMGGCCLYGCTSLTSITLSPSVKTLKNGTFYGCTALKSIIIPSSVTHLESSCFQCCSALESVTIPSSVTEMGGSCFMDCPSLQSVDISASLTKLSASCFMNCTSLKSVVIPSSVTVVGDYCFMNCPSLTSVSIPASVTSMGTGCFLGLKALKTVTCEIPVAIEGQFFINTPISQATLYVQEESLDSYKTTSPWSGFGEIKAFAKEIDYTDNGFVFRLYSATRTADVVRYVGTENRITVPESVTYEGDEFRVTRLGDECFKDCFSPVSVKVASSVTSLGTGCFKGCYSLTSVSLPSTLTALSDYCFEGCNFLSSIYLPSALTTIGEGTFKDCKFLTWIRIPAGVTSLGKNVFDGCNALLDVTCDAVKCPSVSDFGEFPISDATLTVPDESYELYRKSYPWSLFGTIKDFSGTTGINSATAAGKSAVRDVYGLDGKSRDSMKQGLNIIRLDNGKTKKVMVK